MEREILFRGKKELTDEWIYGSFIQPVSGIKSDRVYIGDFWSAESVYPATVGRYTGLIDKNGVKIFVGDIVRYQFDNDDCPFPDKRTDKIIGRIFFSDFRASFSVTAGRNGSDSANNDLFKYVRNGNRVEVIGNIHDNPELLEVQNGTKND